MVPEIPGIPRVLVFVVCRFLNVVRNLCGLIIFEPELLENSDSEYEELFSWIGEGYLYIIPIPRSLHR